MGFRGEALSTPTGVDTGPNPTGPGVRMYQDNTDPNAPRGVVEFRTGTGGKATLALDAFRVLFDYDAAGNPLYRTVGNDFTLSGPEALAAAPARLILREEENPAGGWQTVAGLGADLAELPGATTLVGAQGTGPAAIASRGYVASLAGIVERTAASSYSIGWGPWANGTWQDLGFYLRRDGMVVCTGLARYTGVTGATAKITPLAAAYAPRGDRQHMITALSGATTTDGTPRRVEVRADGLYLAGALPAVNTFLAINAVWPGATAALAT